MRATNVVQLLIDNAGIAPDKLSAVGYGEFRPIAENSSEEGRSKNRRVDIVLVDSKYDNVENVSKDK
ncbi:ompA family protein [Clostridioides difficile DA00142]|nr:ompA family protein [Clostridioides difficile DA00142]